MGKQKTTSVIVPRAHYFTKVYSTPIYSANHRSIFRFHLFQNPRAANFLPSATDPSPFPFVFMDPFAVDDLPVPHHVAPFPDSGDLLYAQPVALIPPPEIVARRQNPPPQKLRPIRCNGRPSPGSQLGELAEDGGMASLNVGYLGNQLCVVNGESSLKLEPLGHHVEAAEALRKEACGGVAGNDCLQMEDPVGCGSGDAEHIWDPNAEGCLLALGQESGSSLDDDDDGISSGSSKEPGSRKRRKKTVRKLEDFVENLVMKVMEKQEEMHKQLVDMIEKKERERIMREEAWKHKEMERIKKDEEARTQERSRNLALMSFIQNLLGQEIQIPQPALSSKREEDEGEVNIQKGFNSDLSNNRWPEVEVQALISVRTSLEHKFRLMGSKGSIWEEISEAMQNMGYNRSAKKCKEKWENINKYYKRTMGSGKKRRQNSKTCPYFDELDILYRNGLLNLGNALSNTNNVPKLEEE